MACTERQSANRERGIHNAVKERGKCRDKLPRRRAVVRQAFAPVRMLRKLPSVVVRDNLAAIVFAALGVT